MIKIYLPVQKSNRVKCYTAKHSEQFFGNIRTMVSKQNNPYSPTTHSQCESLAIGG